MPKTALGSFDDDDGGRARMYFTRAGTVEKSGQSEYAIEMFLTGLFIDPNNLEAHQQLRETSLRRKAAGGRDLGMFEQL